MSCGCRHVLQTIFIVYPPRIREIIRCVKCNCVVEINDYDYVEVVSRALKYRRRTWAGAFIGALTELDLEGCVSRETG